MSKDRIQYLLDRLLEGSCSDAESRELADWMDSLGDEEDWGRRLEKLWQDFHPGDHMDPERAQNMLSGILQQAERPQTRSRVRLFRGWRAAAAILVLAAAALYFLGPSLIRPHADEASATNAPVIRPGKNQAVLILANGKKVLLDSVAVGATVPGARLPAVKVQNGLVSYRSAQGVPLEEPAALNTLSTPRGGQYEIELSDGSRVWLNAASSIRFPENFGDRERNVVVTGEAYFEVANDPARPFTVSMTADDGHALGAVRVLGTHFNINAYDDEACIKTTLLEGSVRVEHEGRARQLAPAEQADILPIAGIVIQKHVDVDEAVAWKNGYFDFQESDIESVMRQLSRWYNVQVVYKYKPAAHFMGTISRKVDIREVLKMLELTGTVHFSVEGTIITVLP